MSDTDCWVTTKTYMMLDSGLQNEGCTGKSMTLFFFFFLKNFLFWIGIYLINNNAVIVSGKHWRDSAINTYVSIVHQIPSHPGCLLWLLYSLSLFNFILFKSIIHKCLDFIKQFLLRYNYMTFNKICFKCTYSSMSTKYMVGITITVKMWNISLTPKIPLCLFPINTHLWLTE